MSAAEITGCLSAALVRFFAVLFASICSYLFWRHCYGLLLFRSFFCFSFSYLLADVQGYWLSASISFSVSFLLLKKSPRNSFALQTGSIGK